LWPHLCRCSDHRARRSVPPRRSSDLGGRGLDDQRGIGLRRRLGRIEAQIHVLTPLISALGPSAECWPDPYTKRTGRAKAQSGDRDRALSGALRSGAKIWVAIVISVGHIGAHRGAAKGGPGLECGRSSGVEHNLAKVRVVSTNLIARSKDKMAGKAEI